MIKRIFDIGFALFGLILSLPILLVAAVAIRLSSKGPVFYRQERVGRYSRPFMLYKLRTMVVDAPAKGPGVSGRRDPRMTSVGHLLRASKLDELPQFLNILKGEMSVVGPRPEIPRMVALYTEEQRKVLEVRPGLVGPSQIIGRNEAEMLPENPDDVEAYYTNCLLPGKLAIDMAYAEHPTLTNDLRYILRSLSATLGGIFNPFSQPSKASWPLLFIIDMALVALSYVTAYLLRFDGAIPRSEWITFSHTLPVVLLVRALSFIYFRLYQSYFKYLGLPDILRALKACSISTAAIVVLIFFFSWRTHSRTIFLIDLLLLVGAMTMVRVLMRRQAEKKPPIDYSLAKRVLMVGAGDIGEMVLREQSKNGHTYRVVGIIDDDPRKHGAMLHGVRVYGGREEIPHFARALQAEEIVIAISTISSEELSQILTFCDMAGLKHRVVPAISDVVSGRLQIAKARNIDVTDLLGHRLISVDLGAIRKAVAGKRVLITGAGGSVGAELAAQILALQPRQLTLLDRSEDYLADLQAELGAAPGLSFVLGDIADSAKMNKLFADLRPELVLHAAGHKNIALSEINPAEAIHTNIAGARILARCADHYGVDLFLFISTEMAVNPQSLAGATRRVAELVFQAYAAYSQVRFVTVRLGSLLSSHGTIVPQMLKQIQYGGPVTLPDKRMERYFLGIPETVSLVLQAMTMGKGGETFIFTAGHKIRIEKLAADMIKQAGLRPYIDIEINYTGLRPGEKLREELLGRGEKVVPTGHKLISALVAQEAPGLPELIARIEKLDAEALYLESAALTQALSELVPEYAASASPEPYLALQP